MRISDWSSDVCSSDLNLGTASKTDNLESGRGWRNSQCRGEIRRYWEEHRWRRRPSGPALTLRRESVGRKRIKIPGKSRRKRIGLGGWGSEEIGKTQGRTK